MIVRRSGTAVGGLLALFHLWLLGSQMWEGQLAEPGLVLRWGIGAGLVAALVHLGRSGAPLIWGRKAVAVWLLAAVLHGPAVAGTVLVPQPSGLPETVTALVQLVAASTLLGLGLVLLAARLARRRHRPFRDARRLALGLTSLPLIRFSAPLTPRPPPAAFPLLVSPL